MSDENVPVEPEPAAPESPAVIARRRWKFARHERDRERVARRQEAFSDIVIGFSLAEIGLSLVMPAHAVDFVTHLAPLFAFVVTFTTVVRYWRTSDVIFEEFFVPSALSTTLNFVALGCLILQVFSLQLYLHFVPLSEGVAASRVYFGFFSLAYGVQGLLLVLGGALRWNALSSTARRLWLRMSLSRGGLVLGTIVGNIFATNDQTKVYATSSLTKADLLNPKYRPPESTLVANFPASIAIDALLGLVIGVALAFVLTRAYPVFHDVPDDDDAARE